ncbi:hypothetical protein K1719_041582 [Acacia pycnantha]|nr:hypothetical protein K1719_041582 [Acacia pycnantha]
MATVSQELNIEKIQGQIREKLSLQLNENNIDVRAFHLCERLRQEKNMLLVLDDLWEELDLGEIGIPLVLFPKLEILELSNLFNRFIAVIWDNQLSHNSFNNLKILIVKRCVFTKLVPLHVLKSLNNLEELEIRSCGMLKTVFDFKDLNDYKEMDSSSLVVPLKRLKLLDLPKLKNIWSNNCQGNVSFPSLKSIDVSYCESLVSIFPASIAKGMLCDLEELYISECGIDVIVAKDQVSESVAAAFQFPGLTSLKLYCLPQLTNFYPHRHTIEWPHLQLLSIKDCDELEIFEKEVSSSLEIHEEDNTINTKYPLFSHDKVIHNLEELNLVGKLAEMIGSGKYPMFHFPKVKLLVLYAYNATTIFYKTLLKSFPNLEDLQLSGRFVEAFGGDDANALASFFPKLTLNDIPITGNLSPFLVSSSNLTHIEVISCNNLITLMTSSTARSLIHLTLLSISNCNQIEEIITKQEGEDDGDQEIFFRKLEFVELTDLPRLRRFCCHNYTFRFSLLDKLVITRCPKFKRFSPGLINTPSLNSVQLSQDWGERHEIWDTNLNKTFYQQRFVASREVVLDEDDAIMIRNGQFPTDHCPQVEILVIERFVEEWVTFPYTLLKRFPKLNELHMKNSSFEEIFPSYAPSSSSFHNLTMLRVSKCHQLVYLVTCSTVKSLVNLEILEMDDCEKLEEILRNETNEDVERGVTFNWLRILKLTRLPKLKTQEDKKDFNIEDRATNTRCTIISRSLFIHNKVRYCHELEMVFGFEDLNDYHKEMESSSSVVVPLNLTHLEVKNCFGLSTFMTSSAAPNLVHITHLSISNCYQIEEIITKQEGEDDEDKEIIFNTMKFLELHNLPRLKRFCGYNYTFRFPLLEHVTITECPRLTMFCPGVIHAPRLERIQVHKYEAHIHIWITDLNNTIQHLFTFEEVISTTNVMVINAKNITRLVDVFPKVRRLFVESFIDEGLKSIWKDDSQLPPNHQNLEVLEVESCCSLVKLAPSSASFQNLRELYISGCHQLIHLVTTSTAKSLVSLRWLEINDCKKMEEIVMNEANEESRITFNQLRKIKLTNMPSLKMFSSQSHTFKFPELEKIRITGCLEMKMFCRGVMETPRLSKVKIEEHDMKWKPEGDLNKTMEELSLQRIALIYRRIASSSMLSSSGVGDDADT